MTDTKVNMRVLLRAYLEQSIARIRGMHSKYIPLRAQVEEQRRQELRALSEYVKAYTKLEERTDV